MYITRCHKYYTIEEAAEILEVNIRRVNKFIDAGLLPTSRIRVPSRPGYICHERVVDEYCLHRFMRKYPGLWGENYVEPTEVCIDTIWVDRDYYDEEYQHIYDKAQRIRNECMMEDYY